MPPCGTNDAPGNTCLIATPICNLDGYCGTTDATYTADTWGDIFSGGLLGAFCGSVENNSFLSFVASSSSISFDVWVYNSTNGDGIQIMIFQPDGNCSGNVTSYYCDQIMPTSPTSPQTVSGSGLVPGETYYIMIDGYAGDVCDYTFAANSGISTPVDINLDAGSSSTTICQGESVTVVATGGNGNYTWVASPDLNTTTGATVTITPPTTVGTYTYYVSSSSGTSLCPQSDEDSIQIIVENCGCFVNAFVDSSQFCENTINTISLYADTLANTTYSWSDGTNVIGTTQTLTNISVPSTPGTYTYTVSATDNLGGVCNGSVSITVNELPSANAGIDSTINCINTSIDLTGSSSTSGVDFSWADDNGNTLSSSSTYNAATAGTYVLTVSNPITTCQKTDTVQITIDTIQPSISISGDTLITTCTSNLATLTAISNVINGNYSWSGPSVVSGNNTNQASVDQQGNYEVTVTNTDNGCTNSANIDVSEFTPPPPSIFSDTAICGTNFQVLADSISVIGGGYWTEINGNGTFTPNNGVVAPNFTPENGIYNYTLVFTDSICGNTADANVTIVPPPTITTPPAYSCNDMSEILYSSSFQGGVWTVNDDPSTSMLEDTALTIVSGNPTSGGFVQNETFVSSHPTHGVYTIVYTDNFCDFTEEYTLNFIGYPWTSVSDTTLCSGSTHSLNAASSPNTLNYNWNNGFTGQSIEVNETGYYVVEASNNCYVMTDTAHVVFNPCDILVPNVISLSSQVGNQLWKVSSSGVEEFNCIILNRWGEMVTEFNDINMVWDGKDKGGKIVSDGVYFYKIIATLTGGEELVKQGFIHVVK